MNCPGSVLKVKSQETLYLRIISSRCGIIRTCHMSPALEHRRPICPSLEMRAGRVNHCPQTGQNGAISWNCTPHAAKDEPKALFACQSRRSRHRTKSKHSALHHVPGRLPLRDREATEPGNPALAPVRTPESHSDGRKYGTATRPQHPGPPATTACRHPVGPFPSPRSTVILLIKGGPA